MTRPTRGAARISVVWMITVLVLFFATLGFAFVATSDLSTQEGRTAAAVADKEKAIARYDTEANAARATAQKIGWYDAASADPRIDLDAVATSSESFKDAFGITEASVKTVQDLFAPAIAAFKAQAKELEEKRTRITTLEGELAQARRTLADVTRQKDAEMATLRQQLADEADKYQRNEQDSSRRLAAAQAQVNELDAARREADRALEEAQKEASKELASLQGRIRSISHKLAIQKQPDEPDGEITAVSPGALPIAWINRGANDRLARGTVFDIVSATPGEGGRVKGQCRVTSLKPNSAEVEVFGVRNTFDPIVSGDLIVNPLYAAGGIRQAVLAGRFSSPSESELIALLDRIGIQVQPELTVDSDYLIVGSPVYTDEDGETLEEPRHPRELDVYREAESKGLNIISVSDLRGYFVF